jgi:hypothetical protein
LRAPRRRSPTTSARSLPTSQAGVTHVEVSDGDDDDDCADADGQVWTLEEALANPIAHPNCVRSFAPADEGDAE